MLERDGATVMGLWCRYAQEETGVHHGVWAVMLLSPGGCGERCGDRAAVLLSPGGGRQAPRCLDCGADMPKRTGCITAIGL